MRYIYTWNEEEGVFHLLVHTMSFTTVTLLKSNDEKVPVVTHTDLSSVVDKMVLPS